MRSSGAIVIAKIAVAALSVGGCSESEPAANVRPGAEGWPCIGNNNCLNGLVCVNEACQVAVADAGPRLDAVVLDAAPDVDAGQDPLDAGGDIDGGTPCPNPATLTWIQANIFGPNGQAHCNQAACHGAAAQGGLSLVGPTATILQNLLGPTRDPQAPETDIVVPFEPEQSRLYVIMRDRQPTGTGQPMPPAGPVPFCDLETVRRWIAEGASDN